MVMVMQPEYSEWPMNSAYVYVILCNVRKDERLVQYVKEKEKINKRCLYGFLLSSLFLAVPGWSGTRGWSGVGSTV
jgi:hypothetical protein